MELTRLKGKLGTAIKGHRLLKDKRDELMREFLDLVRVNMELRKKVEEGIRQANVNFVIARAGMSGEALQAALMAPKQEVSLKEGVKNVMSVNIPQFDYATRTSDPFLRIRIYVQRSRRCSEISGGCISGYAETCRSRKVMPADGSGDRKDPPARQRA